MQKKLLQAQCENDILINNLTSNLLLFFFNYNVLKCYCAAVADDHIRK